MGNVLKKPANVPSVIVIRRMESPKYPILLQKPYHCAMACLQMVAYRHTGRIFDQEELGVRFGVKIPGSVRRYFRHELSALTSHNRDEGICTTGSAEAVTRFFQEEGLPLVAESFPATPGFLEGLPAWLTENLAAGYDLWAEYALVEPRTFLPDRTYLHDSLIIGATADSITLLDPEPKSRNVRTVPLAEFAERMSGSYGTQTGILRIRRVEGSIPFPERSAEA